MRFDFGFISLSDLYRVFTCMQHVYLRFLARKRHAINRRHPNTKPHLLSFTYAAQNVVEIACRNKTTTLAFGLIKIHLHPNCGANVIAH